MNSDGTGHRNLTNTTNLHEAASFWSPDGAHILYESVEYIKVGGRNQNKNAAFIADADGSNTRQVLPWDKYEEPLGWSNDGESIYFYSDKDLYSMKIDGTERINLSDRIGYDVFFKELSDGRILFCRFEQEWIRKESRTVFYTVNPDGSNRRKLSSFLKPVTQFALSPDETQFAYRTRSLDDLGDISVADVDGRNQKVISTELLDERPVWTPDGDRIVFTRTGEGKVCMMMMNPDGTDVEEIESPLKTMRFIAFEPK